LLPRTSETDFLRVSVTAEELPGKTLNTLFADKPDTPDPILAFNELSVAPNPLGIFEGSLTPKESAIPLESRVDKKTLSGSGWGAILNTGVPGRLLNLLTGILDNDKPGAFDRSKFEGNLFFKLVKRFNVLLPTSAAAKTEPAGLAARPAFTKFVPITPAVILIPELSEDLPVSASAAEPNESEIAEAPVN